MTTERWQDGPPGSAPHGQALSVHDFAELKGVECSDQEVRAWCRAGMPHKKTNRGYAIELAPALEWLKGHRTNWTGHGGNRGGGRPRKKTPEKPQAAIPQAPTPQASAPSRDKWKHFENAIEAEEELRRLESGGDLTADADGNVKDADGKEVEFTVAGLLSLPPAQVVQLKVIEEVLTKRVERLTLEKTLVLVSETRRAWSEAAVAASRALRAAARMAAARLQRDRGMKAKEADEVRIAMEEEIDQALLRLRAEFLSDDKDEEAAEEAEP